MLDSRSESGLESICRLLLSRQPTSLRSQVAIRGVGRVDFVLGDRIIVEADGRAWHDGDEPFYTDRSRLLAAARRGYVTIRPTAQQLLYEEEWFDLVVSAMVDRREHLWSARHKRDPRCDGYTGA